MPRLTDRDRDLTRWIADLYAVQIAHIARRLDVSTRTARRRIKALEAWDVLAREVVFHGGGAWWYCTPEGLRWAGRDYAPWSPRPSTIEHLAAVLRVYVHLLRRHPGSAWVGERSLRKKRAQERKLSGRGGRGLGHVPDGELLLPSGERVAIEVDLSRKTAAKRAAIIDRLIEDGYRHIWYFMPSKLANGASGRALWKDMEPAISYGLDFRLEVLPDE